MTRRPTRPSSSRRADQGERVASALAELPPQQLEAVSLAYFEGLTQAEIAARLGVPLGTVKGRLRLALDRLRTLAPAYAFETDAVARPSGQRRDPRRVDRGASPPRPSAAARPRRSRRARAPRRPRPTPGGLRDLADDREPETAASSRTGAAVVGAPEAVEDRGPVLGRDPRSVVGDREPCPPVELAVREPHDSSPLARPARRCRAGSSPPA